MIEKIKELYSKVKPNVLQSQMLLVALCIFFIFGLMVNTAYYLFLKEASCAFQENTTEEVESNVESKDLMTPQEIISEIEMST